MEGGRGGRGTRWERSCPRRRSGRTAADGGRARDEQNLEVVVGKGETDSCSPGEGEGRGGRGARWERSCPRFPMSQRRRQKVRTAGQTQPGRRWGLAWEGQTTRKWMAYWGREQGVGGGGNKLPHLVDGGDRGHKLDVSSFGNSPKPISVIIHWWTGQAWLPGPVQALRSGPPSPTPICLPRLPL